MIDSEEEIKVIINTVNELLKADKLTDLISIFSTAQIEIKQSHYDNWNGGTNYYSVNVVTDIATFIKVRERIESIESSILKKFNFATRHIENEEVVAVKIFPQTDLETDWTSLSGIVSKKGFIEQVNYLKNILISVSTGGQRIQEVNDQYQDTYKTVNSFLKKINLQNPNPFNDLWQWYDKWNTNLAKYTERRIFITELYSKLLSTLEDSPNTDNISVIMNLTNWERLDRSIREIKARQAEAYSEEQFQAVGLLCRESIINLAQSVYNEVKHLHEEKTLISVTDSRRMLEAYISTEIKGGSNEILRRYAKVTLELANELTHKRTASRMNANLCITATVTLINLIGIIEKRELDFIVNI